MFDKPKPKHEEKKTAAPVKPGTNPKPTTAKPAPKHNK